MGSEDENPTTLQPEEILWVREQRRQHAHEQWLRGQIKILWPWIVGGAGAVRIIWGAGRSYPSTNTGDV